MPGQSGCSKKINGQYVGIGARCSRSAAHETGLIASDLVVPLFQRSGGEKQDGRTSNLWGNA